VPHESETERKGKGREGKGREGKQMADITTHQEDTKAVAAPGPAPRAMSDSGSERSTAKEEEVILATVQRLLDTIANRDKTGLSEILVPEGCATLSRDHQISHTQLREFPEKMPGGTSRMEERFHNVLVRIDDDVAAVVAQYDFLFDGEVHHWGTSILSFLKQDGQWRICAIADTGRSGSRPRNWGTI
jgi:hypothetical protein